MRLGMVQEISPIAPMTNYKSAVMLSYKIPRDFEGVNDKFPYRLGKNKIIIAKQSLVVQFNYTKRLCM